MRGILTTVRSRACLSRRRDPHGRADKTIALARRSPKKAARSVKAVFDRPIATNELTV